MVHARTRREGARSHRRHLGRNRPCASTTSCSRRRSTRRRAFRTSPASTKPGKSGTLSARARVRPPSRRPSRDARADPSPRSRAATAPSVPPTIAMPTSDGSASSRRRPSPCARGPRRRSASAVVLLRRLNPAARAPRWTATCGYIRTADLRGEHGQRRAATVRSRTRSARSRSSVDPALAEDGVPAGQRQSSATDVERRRAARWSAHRRCAATASSSWTACDRRVVAPDARSAPSSRRRTRALVGRFGPATQARRSTVDRRVGVRLRVVRRRRSSASALLTRTHSSCAGRSGEDSVEREVVVRMRAVDAACSTRRRPCARRPASPRRQRSACRRCSRRASRPDPARRRAREMDDGVAAREHLRELRRADVHPVELEVPRRDPRFDRVDADDARYRGIVAEPSTSRRPRYPRRTRHGNRRHRRTKLHSLSVTELARNLGDGPSRSRSRRKGGGSTSPSCTSSTSCCRRTSR